VKLPTAVRAEVCFFPTASRCVSLTVSHCVSLTVFLTVSLTVSPSLPAGDGSAFASAPASLLPAPTHGDQRRRAERERVRRWSLHGGDFSDANRGPVLQRRREACELGAVRAQRAPCPLRRDQRGELRLFGLPFMACIVMNRRIPRVMDSRRFPSTRL
jgi:hypothetical protein